MKKVNIFLLITFFLTWSITFIIFKSGGLTGPFASIGLILCMMMPALSVLITTLITKSSFKEIWIKPNFKKNIKYYFIGYFSPVILIILGSALYFIIFPSHLDLSMNNGVENLKLQLQSLSQALPSDLELKSAMIIQLFVSIFLSPILNFIPCLGEELGWRGYLLPKLIENNSYFKSSLIAGVIWGIWHAPMIAMGHNYGVGYIGVPFIGIFAMVVFCIMTGAIFNYITIKTKSCIPATFAHGSLNGFASAGVIFLSIPNPNMFIGPAPVGIIGGFFFIVVGAICLLKTKKLDEENIETKTKA